MKERWDVLPFAAVREVVRAMTMGSKTHGNEHGWRELDPAEAREKYFAAAMRHVVAWRLGEQVDAESGLHPLAHAGGGRADLARDRAPLPTMAD